MLDEKLEGNAKKEIHNIVDNLIRYMKTIYIDFDKNLVFEKEKISKLDYDIFRWEKDNYNKPLTDYYEPEGISYLFYIPGEQHDALISNINQFRHKNRNVTLRKMSEYMKKADLFYKIKVNYKSSSLADNPVKNLK